MGGPSGCLSILSGDAVQHILIRNEMDRRNIPWREPWLRTYPRPWRKWKVNPTQGPPTAARPSPKPYFGLDVSLGLTDTQWPERTRS
jgi:hypothetical protein